MLLFWPCLWGLTLAFNQTNDLKLYLKYIILFLFGSILMRSTGCIFNDIVDKKFDKKVKRTKKRPIASGKISVLQSFVYIFALCFFSLIILLQFNFLTIILGLLSMPLAFAYPYMKRITYWPQFFLGITFNWGIIMGWAAITNNLMIEPFVLYLSAIFWTLGYDTIYGFQDIKDDEIIGVKSTSIKFKKNHKLFIGMCYSLCILFLIIMGSLKEFNIYYFSFLILPAIHLCYQVINLKKASPNNCLDTFKSNNFFGFLLFIVLIVTKV